MTMPLVARVTCDNVNQCFGLEEFITPTTLAAM